MGYLADIRMALHGDDLNTDVSLQPEDPQAKLRLSDLHLDTRFRTVQDKPHMDFRLASGQIMLEDTTFLYDDIVLSYTAAHPSIQIDQLHLYTSSGAQELTVNGVASHSMSDALNLRLHGINAGYLMPLVVAEKSFKMGGTVDGWATLYAALDKPMIDAEVRIKDYAMGDEVIGDADGAVHFNPARKLLEFEAHVADSIRERADVHGAVELSSGHWEVNIAPTHIPLAFIGYWTRGFMPEIGGYGSGRVKVFGWPGATYVLTRVKAEDGTIRVPFTGCRYHLNDSVFMDSTSIRFPNMTLTDDNGNPIEFDGRITHNQFRNFKFHLVAKPHKAIPGWSKWLIGAVAAGGLAAGGHSALSDSQEPEGEGVYVVSSTTSKSYHKTKDCTSLRNARHPIIKVEKEEAIKQGKTPCKKCYEE
jgi:hypothetical protein